MSNFVRFTSPAEEGKEVTKNNILLNKDAVQVMAVFDRGTHRDVVTSIGTIQVTDTARVVRLAIEGKADPEAEAQA